MARARALATKVVAGMALTLGYAVSIDRESKRPVFTFGTGEHSVPATFIVAGQEHDGVLLFDTKTSARSGDYKAAHKAAEASLTERFGSLVSHATDTFDSAVALLNSTVKYAEQERSLVTDGGYVWGAPGGLSDGGQYTTYLRTMAVRGVLLAKGQDPAEIVGKDRNGKDTTALAQARSRLSSAITTARSEGRIALPEPTPKIVTQEDGTTVETVKTTDPAGKAVTITKTTDPTGKTVEVVAAVPDNKLPRTYKRSGGSIKAGEPITADMLDATCTLLEGFLTTDNARTEAARGRLVKLANRLSDAGIRPMQEAVLTPVTGVTNTAGATIPAPVPAADTTNVDEAVTNAIALLMETFNAKRETQ